MKSPGVLAAILFCVTLSARERIDLNGEWQFRTDPTNVGEREEWHSAGVAFERAIRVPGAWQAQGVGEPSGVVRHNYSGPAWYKRSISVPAAWSGKAIHLRVGGALRRTAVYVNGRKLGEHDGFSAPFRFDVTSAVRPGGNNVIALRVVNPATRPDEAPHAQASTEPTGMMNYIANWGGVYGNVALEATAPSWVKAVAIRPHVADQAVSVQVALDGSEAPPGARVRVEVNGRNAEAPIAGRAASLRLSLPGARPWTPETPHLYTAVVRLLDGSREIDRIEERFGMREITTRGRTLLLNGKPLYLRGYGDDNVEVLTGFPPASRDEYLKRLRLVRDFGFNAVRFHSMTPVREFFEAADEVGLFVMAELPAAYTMHFLPHRDFLKAELQRVLTEYRNRPSFLSLAFGNEFNLNWLKTDAEKRTFQDTVKEFYDFAKSIDPERLILSNDGLVLRPTDMFSLYTGAPDDAPTVRHEFGSYYCSLPDTSLIPQFTGVLSPTWLEQKKQWVEQSGLAAKYPDYVRNSWKLQQLGRKYQIERVRRIPEISGYHYWLILDYPGGTGEGDSWEEGWFDYFWRPKGIEHRDGRELNSSVLLMLGAGVGDRSLWNGTEKAVDVSLSNYGEEPISGGTITWTLSAGGKSIASGEVNRVNAPLGQVVRAGSIQVRAADGDAPRKLELALTLRTGTSTYTNRWNFWSFPRIAAASAPGAQSNIRWTTMNRLFPTVKPAVRATDRSVPFLTSKLDRDTAAFLKNGGTVWLLAEREQFERPGDASFFPASGGALGTMIADHPALGDFPHDGYLDLQFYNLLEGGWWFPVDSWPKDMQPIAGGIRTTSSFLSKMKNLSRTAFIAETRVGSGRLLITTLRIRELLDEAYPEAVYLFDRLLRYVASPAFQPQVTAPESAIERLAVQ